MLDFDEVRVSEHIRTDTCRTVTGVLTLNVASTWLPSTENPELERRSTINLMIQNKLWEIAYGDVQKTALELKDLLLIALPSTLVMEKLNELLKMLESPGEKECRAKQSN